MAAKSKTKIKISGGGDKVREERAKLMASFVSSLGIGVIIIGVARPLLAPRFLSSIDMAVAIISILLGLVLHLLGRVALIGMREPPKEASSGNKPPHNKGDPR